jgi:hypothetical protein
MTRLLLPTALLATLLGCGWLAQPQQLPTEEGSEDPAANMPKCRPAGALAKRVDPPWSKGMSTGAGYQVTHVTFQETTDPGHSPEYVRVGFKKGAVETALEIAYNAGEPSDWSTANYRLMPAPEQEPPQDLLDEAIGTLRKWDTANPKARFVQKREGLIDPYEGLPPCKADGTPP